MAGTLAWQRSGLGDACQSGKMATLKYIVFRVFALKRNNCRQRRTSDSAGNVSPEPNGLLSSSSSNTGKLLLEGYSIPAGTK